MTATPSTPLFKSSKVRLSCHQYLQDSSIMPCNSVQSHFLCWHCEVHCSSHNFPISQSRAAGYVQCLALCWTCSTSLFQTILKLPHSESKEGKGKKNPSLKQLSAALSQSSITRAAWDHQHMPMYPAPLKKQHCQKVPHGKHLDEVPCSQGTPSPALVWGKQTCPLTAQHCLKYELEYWKCLDRQTLLGINCSLACLTPSQSNSLVYVLQVVTALHLLFKLSCPFYKYSIKAP